MTIAFFGALSLFVVYFIAYQMVSYDLKYEISEKKRYQQYYDELAVVFDRNQKELWAIKDELKLERDKNLILTESLIIIKNQTELAFGDKPEGSKS